MQLLKNIDGYDILISLGILTLGIGIGFVSIPIALMVTGGILMALGILGAAAKGRN